MPRQTYKNAYLSDIENLDEKKIDNTHRSFMDMGQAWFDEQAQNGGDVDEIANGESRDDVIEGVRENLLMHMREENKTSEADAMALVKEHNKFDEKVIIPFITETKSISRKATIAKAEYLLALSRYRGSHQVTASTEIKKLVGDAETTLKNGKSLMGIKEPEAPVAADDIPLEKVGKKRFGKQLAPRLSRRLKWRLARQEKAEKVALAAKAAKEAKAEKTARINTAVESFIDNEDLPGVKAPVTEAVKAATPEDTAPASTPASVNSAEALPATPGATVTTPAAAPKAPINTNDLSNDELNSLLDGLFANDPKKRGQLSNEETEDILSRLGLPGDAHAENTAPSYDILGKMVEGIRTSLPGKEDAADITIPANRSNLSNEEINDILDGLFENDPAEKATPSSEILDKMVEEIRASLPENSPSEPKELPSEPKELSIDEINDILDGLFPHEPSDDEIEDILDGLGLPGEVPAEKRKDTSEILNKMVEAIRVGLPEEEPVKAPVPKAADSTIPAASEDTSPAKPAAEAKANEEETSELAKSDERLDYLNKKSLKAMNEDLETLKDIEKQINAHAGSIRSARYVSSMRIGEQLKRAERIKNSLEDEASRADELLIAKANEWNIKRLNEYREKTFRKHYRAYDTYAQSYYALTRQLDDEDRAIGDGAVKSIAEYIGIYDLEQMALIGNAIKETPYIVTPHPVHIKASLKDGSKNEISANKPLKYHHMMTFEAFAEGIDNTIDEEEADAPRVRMKMNANFQGYKARRQFISRSSTELKDVSDEEETDKENLSAAGEMGLTIDERGTNDELIYSEENAKIHNTRKKGVKKRLINGVVIGDKFISEDYDALSDMKKAGAFHRTRENSMIDEENVRAAIRRSDFFRHVNAATIQYYEGYNAFEDFTLDKNFKLNIKTNSYKALSDLAKDEEKGFRRCGNGGTHSAYHS